MEIHSLSDVKNIFFFNLIDALNRAWDCFIAINHTLYIYKQHDALHALIMTLTTCALYCGHAAINVHGKTIIQQSTHISPL